MYCYRVKAAQCVKSVKCVFAFLYSHVDDSK